MKKLRMWVKVVLIVLAIFLLVLSVKLLNNYNNKVIDMCVEGGHSYNWCVRELNK